MKLFKKQVLLRGRVIFLVVMCSMCIIIAKIVYIQLLQRTYWENIAQKAHLTYQAIPATRGNIYGDEDALLATSLSTYLVAMDPTIAPKKVLERDIDKLTILLAQFYFPHANAEEQSQYAQSYKVQIAKGRTNGKKYIVFNQQTVSYKERKEMEQWPIFEKGKGGGGVIFEKKETRCTPFAELARRTIGYIKSDIGVGIEATFDKELQGTSGRALFQKVVGNNWKEIVSENKIMPVHGYDITTTIDINLQDIAHTSLLQALQNSNAKHGCAVVMEVKTGHIKAMVNLSRTTSNIYKEQYNHAIGSAIEPGSGFKIISMLALLEETSTKLTDTIDTYTGEYPFYNRIMKDVSAKYGGHGKLTVQEVFEKSSNVGIARLVDNAFGKKGEKFIDYIYKVGLGKRLGFQLPGEAAPYIITPKSKYWNKVTLPWMSIGYNTKITPLQMLYVYNGLANQGKLIQPIIVKNIKHANKIIKEFKPTVGSEKICSDKTLQQLKIMLEGSVARGTSRGIKHGFYKMAGKTGTAQIVTNGRYSNENSTSFVGYFPADQPRYSCIVVVNSPQGKEYHFGSQVAAPVFKHIVDRIAGKDLAAMPPIQQQLPSIIKWKNRPLIHPGSRKELTYLCEKLHLEQKNKCAGEWITPRIKHNQIHWYNNNKDPNRVPNVRGMQLQDALFLLEKRGLNVDIAGELHGVVSSQSITPYSKLKEVKERCIRIKLK